MPKFVLDGVEREVPAGLNVIEAAALFGTKVPHFCWHPKLKVSGNCRMCLVDVKPGPPKFSIACNTIVADGMTVETKTERVMQARRGVLEFLLLNHPLDCPVCDKAYECTLQDYTYDYGISHSRWEAAGLHEDKRTYERKDFGDKMFVEMNRCVQCTRCIRVLRDVAGEYELGRTERGHALEIASYKDTLTSDFQLNAVDVCPVGALGDKKYRFTARVWDMYARPSVCGGCSIQCSVDVWTKENAVKRLTPRRNDFVNSSWMCDTGRHGFDFANSPDRFGQPFVRDDAGGHAPTEWAKALAAVSARLKDVVAAHGGKSVGLVLGAGLTNEEYFAASVFAKAAGIAHVGFVPGENKRPYRWVDSDVLPDTLVSDDKTFNTNGALSLGVAGAIGGKDVVTATVEAIERKKDGLKALIVLGENLLDVRRTGGARVGPDAGRVAKALQSLDLLIVADREVTATAELAHVVLPTVTHWEKEGTATNWNRHVQAFKPAFAFEHGRPVSELTVITELARAINADFPRAAPSAWFARLAAAVPDYAGLTFDGLLAAGGALGGVDSAVNAQIPAKSAPAQASIGGE